MERGVIEIAPLAYMRGGHWMMHSLSWTKHKHDSRSDENVLDPSRLSIKMIVNGDTSQIDLPRGTTSGLVHAERTLKQIKIDFVNFEASDVVRHPVVAEIIKAYERRIFIKNKLCLGG